jgi:protein O-mannosyl-transferase
VSTHRKRTRDRTLSSTRVARRAPRSVLFFHLALALLVCVTFWNSQAGTFLFDDFASIHQNATIRELWPPWAALNPPGRGESVAGRPLANLTLAVNYAVGGLDVRGYHVVNVLLHLTCVLMAFALTRRLLKIAGPSTVANLSNEIAFAIAAIWAVHPLQTEVVDYIVARTESLMGACYLLWLYASVRAHERPGRRWNTVAILAAALGMLSKESMATAPVAVVLIDRAWLFPSFAEAFKARRSLYLGLCATLLILVALATTSPRGNSAGFAIRSDAAAEVSLLGYLRNQSLIVPHYFKLLAWPTELVLDYGYAAPLNTTEVLPYAAAVTVSCVLIVWLWFANRRAALPLVLCLLLLAPTTLVPIVSEVGAERRMYLPSLALISALLVYCWPMVPRKAALIATGALAAALAVTSVQRNEEYFSTYQMWRTVVDRRPHGRAYLNLAVAANDSGRTSEVLPLLRQAVVDFPDAEHALGARLYQERAYAEAIEHLETFLRLRPTHFQAEAAKQLLIKSWTDLAIQDTNRGRLPQAHEAFVQASRLDPRNPDLLRNLATSFFVMNRRDEAERIARQVLEYRPGDEGASELLREIRETISDLRR